jgi:hypothetical protein
MLLVLLCAVTHSTRTGLLSLLRSVALARLSPGWIAWYSYAYHSVSRCYELEIRRAPHPELLVDPRLPIRSIASTGAAVSVSDPDCRLEFVSPSYSRLALVCADCQQRQILSTNQNGSVCVCQYAFSNRWLMS